MWPVSRQAAAVLVVCSSVRHAFARSSSSSGYEESGDDNMPNVADDGPTDELAFPYFNVHYHFNKFDWNRILDDQQKLIALRRRVENIRRQIHDDATRTEQFMGRQDGLLTDARASLFQRALHRTTSPKGSAPFKKQPADLHDRLHMVYDDFHAPVPTEDFVDINEPYYYGLLAEQRS